MYPLGYFNCDTITKKRTSQDIKGTVSIWGKADSNDIKIN